VSEDVRRASAEVWMNQLLIPFSAFTEAILVTPMGALSVVICAILSHFFLKEKLTFFVSLGEKYLRCKS
jgi:uncharacterized membrane protein